MRDTVATKVYRAYLHETNEEIERKRGVWRGLILNGQDVAYNEARVAGLNQIVHRRQRRKERREDLAEWTEWGQAANHLGEAGGRIRRRCRGQLRVEVRGPDVGPLAKQRGRKQQQLSPKREGPRAGSQGSERAGAGASDTCTADVWRGITRPPPNPAGR